MFCLVGKLGRDKTEAKQTKPIEEGRRRDRRQHPFAIYGMRPPMAFGEHDSRRPQGTTQQDRCSAKGVPQNQLLRSAPVDRQQGDIAKQRMLRSKVPIRQQSTNYRCNRMLVTAMGNVLATQRTMTGHARTRKTRSPTRSALPPPSPASHRRRARARRGILQSGAKQRHWILLKAVPAPVDRRKATSQSNACCGHRRRR